MQIIMKFTPRQLEILTGVMMEHMIFLEDEGLVNNDCPALDYFDSDDDIPLPPEQE